MAIIVCKNSTEKFTDKYMEDKKVDCTLSNGAGEGGGGGWGVDFKCNSPISMKKTKNITAAIL